MSNELFPKVKKSINDLIDDEEGNIPRSKLVVIGSTIMLMGMIMGIDVYATHRSHTSHSSHSSTSYHRSHVSHTSARGGGSHSNHSSHSSHSNTHSSHSSHSSHANTHSSAPAHANTHSSAPAHVNSNTTPQHANSAGGSILGTSEIPKIETPVANDFVGDLPDAATTLSTKIVTDLTDKPKFK